MCSQSCTGGAHHLLLCREPHQKSVGEMVFGHWVPFIGTKVDQAP